MRTLCWAVAAVCCAPLLCTANAQELSSAANLIVNGSFEEPPCASAQGVCGETAQSLEGWTLSDALYRYTTKYNAPPLKFKAQDGKAWLNLTGLSPKQSIRQTVKVQPNKNYTLSFYVGNLNNPEADAGVSSQTAVVVDGATVLHAPFSTPAGSVMKWKQFFVVVMSNASGKMVVSFRNEDPAGDNVNGIDNVSLTLGGTPLAESPADLKDDRLNLAPGE